ncbi:MAG TPA: YceI family protein [Bacteroidia bacterium]|nr:YceI family protein [Bacteroidia bacterium]
MITRISKYNFKNRLKKDLILKEKRKLQATKFFEKKAQNVAQIILSIPFICILLWSFQASNNKMIMSATGEIVISSHAPLETISAQSNQLKGVVNKADRTFAFTVPIRSFEGFNSPLQKEHFNESYLESSKYANATFKGQIIEKINFDNDTVCFFRCKGLLKIHGVEKERIIRLKMEVKQQQITVDGNFIVPLSDHNIYIPKIVMQKISSEIKTEISVRFINTP